MKNSPAHSQREVLKRSDVIAPAKIDAAPSAAPAIIDADPSVMSAVASGQATKYDILGAHVNEAIDYPSNRNNDKYTVKGLDLDVDAINRKASASAPDANAASGNAKNNPRMGNESANGAFSQTDEDTKKHDAVSSADKKGAVTSGAIHDDVLTGTEKGNQINGSNGDDIISGNAGADTLLGGNGDDKIDGGIGDDFINGGNGDDVISGNAGADTLLGGNGDDKIDGGIGDDFINGGNGDDVISGNAGADILLGGNGNDYLIGGAGNDTLNGGNGDDVLVAGQGRDLLIGGDGNDLYLFTKDSLGTNATTTSLMVGKGDTIDLAHLGLYQAEGIGFSGKAGEMLILRNGSVTTLLGDVDGDGKADIDINVIGEADAVPDMLVLASAPVRPAPVEPAPVDPAPQPIQAVVSATAQEDRVAKLEIPDSVTNGLQIKSIRILEQPDTGHVSVSPEKGISLVMTDAQKGFAHVSFSYEVTLADNTVVRVDADVDLTPAQNADGWGLGEGYMLETDSKGDLILEHGENHRKIFVSGGEHALTKEDIAAMEGTTVAAIEKTYGGWGNWLAKNPEYGATEDMALTAALGMALWNATTAFKTTSNWLLFERGYEYPEAQRLFARGANGESELNPLVVMAYGQGEDPQLGNMNVFQNQSANMVITGVKLGGAQALLGTNLLVDNVTVTSESNFQNVNGLTIRRSDFVDIFRDAPVNDGDTWAQHISRVSGTYIANSQGVRLESNLFDHNGWAEGYDYNLAASSPMPPSMYNHNIYLQSDNYDVSLVDNIIMRGASFGAQVRSGGFIEDNAFIDNNAAVNFFGGGKNAAGESLGNYTLMNGNIITSAGHKRVSLQEGALSFGIDDFGKQTSLIENIIAHMADPANAAEIAEKTVTHHALSTSDTRFFDDTIVYRWAARQSNSLDNNTEGRDVVRMDKTTIQQFASQLLGKEGATIADLAALLRAQAHGQLDAVVDADLIIAFFREGFGLDVSARTGSEMLVFTPDERSDGIRWDNRLNWSTDDLPGTRDGDSVDLTGNAVHFGNYTVAVDDFNFGDFGKLSATSGKLTIDGEIAVGDMGASLSIDRAGQVWINGYRDSDILKIDVAGGRFANKGDMIGTINMHVSDNAQALLAIPGGSFDLMDGSSLAVEGSRVKVGFDGHNGDTGVLRMHDGSTLSFIADVAGLSTLGEFRSGTFGKAPEIDTAIRLGGDLKIDVTAWGADTASVSETLIKADEIVGSFDSIKVIGMAGNRNATIVIDYDADEFRFVMGPANGTGTGEISTIVIGADSNVNWPQKADMQNLWQALHDSQLSSVDDPLLL